MIVNVANANNTFVYNCNGVNDDIKLLTFIANLRSRGFSNFKVQIVGGFVKSETTAITVDNSGYTPITLDFSHCNRITSRGAFLNVTNVRVLGCSVYHQVNSNDSEISTFTGNNSHFEHCEVTGGYYSGTCYAFNLTESTMIGCSCDIYNADGMIFGVYGSDSLISSCKIKVKSNTASAYGIEVTKSFVVNSKFKGETGSNLTTTSGNGGIGGGYYSNCLFIGIGALKGQGFFIRGGAWLTMNNCVARGYTKDTSNGWGVGITGQSNEATTFSILGVNCNQTDLSGFSQNKSFELLGGYGVYSGTFFTAPNVASTITSLGSYNRNRNQ